MNVKTLRLPLFFSLLILLVPLISVRADDQVTIKIQMEGDAYVTITNNNGSLTFTYNGVDVINSLASKDEVRSIQSQLSAVDSRTAILYHKIRLLVKELDKTFSDLYRKVYYLAHVTGIYNGNDNSTVTLQLKSGNMTLVDFVDQLLNVTETQGIQIKNLSLEVSSNHKETQKKLSQAFNEIALNREYYEDKIRELDSKLDSKITLLREEVNQKLSDLSGEMETFKNTVTLKLNGLTLVLWCIGFLNVIMVGLIAWISRWKAKQT